MASSARPHQQSSQEGAVVERRLRPIYEWLDNGNNKKALQEAEKVLRKTPSLQIARALRALAILRLGRTSEALAALEALAAEKPCDDNTLQAMTISYRESHQLRKVCELYEAAVASDPTSEDLYSQLFMAYVRVGDFRAQQQTALALYKVAPKNPYYFWAVMSIVLQAREAEGAMVNILLSLAQRMVDKFIAERKLEAQQETQIYIMILEMQEKYDDILKFMGTSNYYSLNPDCSHATTIPYVQKCGRWWHLNTICKALLCDNLDRWDYYVPYFDSMFELFREEYKDESPETCHEFICQLIERIPANKLLRGPYLARMELYKRLKETDRNPEGLMGDVVDVCVEYLRVFAHKPCCVADLKPYLSMIPLGERRRRCREFLTCLGMDEHTMPETLDEVQRHVSCIGVWLLCAGDVRAAALAATLRSHYLRALARGLSPATKTEFTAADSYAVHSARLFYIAAQEQKSSGPILEGLSLLEFVLKKSPSNFHCKLLALKFYHLLGNGYAAESIYTQLEVKHITLSSLGWLHSAALASCAAFALCLSNHQATAALHTNYAKDSTEYLTYSYKYGTLDKLVELMGFVGRVERCAWCAAATLERALISALRETPGGGGPRHLPDNLSDNRDLTIMRNFDPPHLHNPNLQEETFQHDLAHIKLRSAILNSITLSIELISACHGSDKERENRDSLLKEMYEALSAFDKSFVEFKQSYRCPESSDLVSSPFPNRIIGFVNSLVPYRELYSQALSLPIPLAVGDCEFLYSQCDKLERLVRESTAVAREALASVGDALWENRRRLEMLSYHVELIGIITLQLGVCHELVNPAQNKNKKKQSHVQTPSEQKTTETLNKVNLATQEAVASLEDIVKHWPEPNVPENLEEMFGQLSLTDGSAKNECCVTTKLQSGHEEVMNDLKCLLAMKSKSLKNIAEGISQPNLFLCTRNKS